MKKIYGLFVVLAAVSVFAVAAHASPPRAGVLPLNYKVKGTPAYQKATFEEKIEMTGKSSQGAAQHFDDAFGCQHWRDHDNLTVVGQGTIPPAKTGNKNFANTGLDRNGKTVAYADGRAYAVAYATVVCKIEKHPVDVKIDCTNTLPRGPEQAKSARKLPKGDYHETTDLSQVLDIDIDVRASATAVVNNDIKTSASTAPITVNVIGGTQPTMAFQPLGTPFSWHSSSNQLITGSISFARPGDINIWNKVISVNNNSNANTNVLNNVNNIVTGDNSAGSASGAGAGSSNAGSGNGRAP